MYTYELKQLPFLLKSISNKYDVSYINLNMILSSLFSQNNLITIYFKQISVHNSKYFWNYTKQNHNLKYFTFSTLLFYCYILNNSKNKLLTTLDFIYIIYKIYYNELNSFLNYFSLLFFIDSPTTPYLNGILDKFSTILICSNLKIYKPYQLNDLNLLLNLFYIKPILLIGSVGSGRHSFINLFTYFYPVNNCYRYISLNILLNIQLLTEFKLFLVYILNNNIKTKYIFIIPSYNLFFNTNLPTYSLLSEIYNLLTIAIQKQYIKIIGLLTNKEYTLFKQQDSYNESNYSCLNLIEPTPKEIFSILVYLSNKLSNQTNISFSTILIPKLIKLSNQYIKNIPSPLKFITILDYIYSTSKVQQITSITDTIIFTNILKLANIKTNRLLDPNPKILFTYTSLYTYFSTYIYGQEQAIETVCNTLLKVKLNLVQSSKPQGSWLFCGPSGTGKTELAKILSQFLFGNSSHIIRFDMSEYMEKHSLSKLIGSPPGYIGYGEGGQLTEQIKKHPFSIILFDEIEKAHPDIYNLMLQLLDEGHLTDSTGEKIDFSQTFIIFTSNLGCPKTISAGDLEFKILKNKIMGAINSYFKPEFLNRLDDIIIFKFLSKSILYSICNKFIDSFQKSLYTQSKQLTIRVNNSLLNYIINLSFKPIYGARPLKRILFQIIEKPIINLLLQYKFNNPYLLYFTYINYKLCYSLIPINNK